MKSKVALVYCDSYEISEVRRAVVKGLELLGGAGAFVRQGERIVLKVNLLVGDVPEKCVNTHPVVFRCVAEQFAAAGAIVQYGDSPGFSSPYAAARKAGIAPVAAEMQIELADFKKGREVYFEKGLQNKKFFIANGVLDADGIISLPKLKTHGLEIFTGCIKNQFGCMVGMRKSEFHMKLPDAKSFARMLVDLNNGIRPRLYIMDGIVAMEGNGPRSGNARPMNVLLFSTDPVALDATACRLISLNPANVPTTVFGSESGAGTWLEEEIEIAGDEITRFVCPDFDVDRKPVKIAGNYSAVKFINNRLIPKPVIVREKCTQCGTCVQSCPVVGKAVNWPGGDHTQVPVYDYDKCIRCYCCQELCPEGAVILKDPVMRKVVKIFS
jgi:uncharacterized protein (DUF362 family)/Pyruvate/2-oxoacid:ferredoxin oxidoreductase delta subunit